MPTLLLSARQTDDTQLLWRACNVLKWHVVRVHGWSVPALDANDLTVYGEPLFVHHVAQTLKLKLTEPPLDWLPNIPSQWRGRDVRLTTLADARKNSGRAFIKPAGEKSFDAKIYAHGAELPPPGSFSEELAVIVQEVVEWKTEFRCFVLNRKVATLSPYWRQGRSAKAADGSWPASEEEMGAAKSFCERVLADNSVEVPKAIAIDVGQIANHGWAVIESNAVCSSGIYGCDAEKVLPVLMQACTGF